MKKINLDSYVFVKLTTKGKIRYSQYWKTNYGNEIEKDNKYGFHRFRLWAFMEVFGNYSDNVFEDDEIYFSEDDLWHTT